MQKHTNMSLKDIHTPRLRFAILIFAGLSLIESLSLAESRNLLTRNQTVGEIPVNICNSAGECKILSSSGIYDSDTFAYTSGKLSLANVGDAHIEVGFSCFRLFRQISLTNEGCEGLLTAQVSDDRVKWNEIAKMNFDSKDELIEMLTGNVFSKYLRLSFKLPTAGKLGALKVFGEKTHSNYKVIQDETSESRVNFASGYGAERLVYSSELKEQLQTRLDSLDQALHFESNESGNYMVVCDMRTERWLTEITSFHSTGVKSMSVFAVKNLPEKTNWKGKCILDKTDLEKSSVLVARVNSVGGNNLKVNIPDSVISRYYVVAWQTDLQVVSSQPLVVYGLGLIGMATVTSIDNFTSNKLLSSDFSKMPKTTTTIDTLRNNDAPIVAYNVGPGVLNSSYSNTMKEKSFSSKISSALNNLVTSFRASPATVGTKANIRLLNCDYPSRAP
jgi:hypothetical protein